jgi:uncharacterized protein (UPF0548 family)
MMRTLRKPTAELVAKFLAQQSKSGFTYSPVGATSGARPKGYRLNQTRVTIGKGAGAFEAAKVALGRWEQFRIGWTEVQPADAPIVPGAVVAVVAHRLGIWWLNACRIVYLIDEKGPVERSGYAYGTLADHVGSGEERFLIEWDHGNDEVSYEVLAYSRPHVFLTRVGYPYMRWCQRLFGRRSAEAVIRAVNELEGTRTIS